MDASGKALEWKSLFLSINGIPALEYIAKGIAYGFKPLLPKATVYGQTGKLQNAGLTYTGRYYFTGSRWIEVK